MREVFVLDKAFVCDNIAHKMIGPTQSAKIWRDAMVKAGQPAQTLNAQERAALVDTVRRLLAERSDEAAVRRTMDTPTGYDSDLWNEMAALGLLGLIIPERHGGTGLGLGELELVAEAMGEALLCSPFLSNCVLAASLLLAFDHDEHLAEMAAGTRIVTVAVASERGGWTRSDVAVCQQDGMLAGTAGFVLDAQIADRILVAAKDQDEIVIHDIAADSPGVTIRPLRTFDRTRRMAHVTFDQVAGNPVGAGWDAVEHALNHARIAMAGDEAGGARAIFDRTVEYIRQRHQFGRPVGGFQAIKHMAADLLLECESATSAARHAAALFDAGDVEANAAIALAAFSCADIYGRVSADAIQMHGGIGFTWAHPAHLFLRRARADGQLFGTPAFHRERFVTAIGG